MSFSILIDPDTELIHNTLHFTTDKERYRFLDHHRKQCPGLVEVLVEGKSVIVNGPGKDTRNG